MNDVQALSQQLTAAKDNSTHLQKLLPHEKQQSSEFPEIQRLADERDQTRLDAHQEEEKQGSMRWREATESDKEVWESQALLQDFLAGEETHRPLHNLETARRFIYLRNIFQVNPALRRLKKPSTKRRNPVAGRPVQEECLESANTVARCSSRHSISKLGNNLKNKGRTSSSLKRGHK